ncbi:hypothetical protein PGH07_03240 [Sulfurovum sp. zt1-1]|uniref:Uncharacterized protein n=1 Tax=Sulfurovum zhangzhouensis TaxID=3019067 RepID=A0ABT7QWH4_9BACT|nr:hypothetical protein [Sulfurovum zhangzhouensis]MDM5271181.1 hypothetical protein [Sulfurovum zhangzhouensis]
MSKTTTLIKTIKLPHTNDGKITIVNINEPYGEFSTPVTSIGISLDDSDPEWIVHIPIAKIDELIAALQEAKKVCEQSDTGYHLHDELGADTGGGGA